MHILVRLQLHQTHLVGAAFVGLMVVGLIYVLVATIIRFVGKAWLDTLLPPVVIGPMIAIIGISLASVATGQAGYLQILVMHSLHF